MSSSRRHEEEESNCLYHAPCPKCGSKDNLAVYDDGHTHCFGCKAHTNAPKEGTVTEAPKKRAPMGAIPFGEYAPLKARGINKDTCEKFRYFISEHNGQPVQVATYYKGGDIVAQHVRGKDKKFLWTGDSSSVELFGQHLWKEHGKMLVITEGEIDCMTMSQLQGNKWPVVSIPSGATAAAKAIKDNYLWVDGFETVVFMFDNDEPGEAAALECAALLSPGKAKIAKLPLKDANDMLKAGRGEEAIRAMWDAKVYRPDEIVPMTEMWEEITDEKPNDVIPTPWESLNSMMNGGLPRGQLIVVAGGTGLGKSQVCRELAYQLHLNGQKIGVIGLEENRRRSSKHMMSIDMNKRLVLDRRTFAELPKAEAEERRASFDRIKRSFVFCSGFKKNNISNLMSNIRHLVRGCDCQWVILDPLIMVFAGASKGGSERELIDEVLKELRVSVEELNCGLIAVSHLTKPQNGKPFEEGGQVSLNNMRGSGNIASIADIVIAVEGNQQHEDKKERLRRDIRLLKLRDEGSTGLACSLLFDKVTGRYSEIPLDSPVRDTTEADELIAETTPTPTPTTEPAQGQLPCDEVPF